MPSRRRSPWGGRVRGRAGGRGATKRQGQAWPLSYVKFGRHRRVVPGVHILLLGHDRVHGWGHLLLYKRPAEYSYIGCVHNILRTEDIGNQNPFL